MRNSNSVEINITINIDVYIDDENDVNVNTGNEQEQKDRLEGNNQRNNNYQQDNSQELSNNSQYSQRQLESGNIPEGNIVGESEQNVDLLIDYMPPTEFGRENVQEDNYFDNLHDIEDSLYEYENQILVDPLREYN